MLFINYKTLCEQGRYSGGNNQKGCQVHRKAKFSQLSLNQDRGSVMLHIE